ncbi:MAG: peptidyl-prolyl cis-trans isomerase [Planctomycetes bacterium]|nr:peptidyl-prolyl cis-trans isomerase [Planctomycetota bacterium]
MLRFFRKHQRLSFAILLLFCGIPMLFMGSGLGPDGPAPSMRAARVLDRDVTLGQIAALLPDAPGDLGHLLTLLEAHELLDEAIGAGVGRSEDPLEDQVGPAGAEGLLHKAREIQWDGRQLVRAARTWWQVRAHLEQIGLREMSRPLGIDADAASGLVRVDPLEVQQLVQWGRGQVPEDRAQREIAKRQVTMLSLHLLSQAAQPSRASAYPSYRRDRQDRRARTVSFEATAFSPVEADLSEEDLRAHHEEHKDLPPAPGRSGYRAGERVTLFYLLADRAQLELEVAVTGEEIAAFYAEHPDRWKRVDETARTPEEGTQEGAPPPDGETPEPEVPVRTLEEVREEIRAELVRERLDNLVRRRADAAYDAMVNRRPPEDPARVAEELGLQSGLVGPVEREELAEAVAFGTLPSEAIHKIFEGRSGRWSTQTTCPRGVFLFQVRDRLPPGPVPFEEARAQVVRDLSRERGFAKARQTAEACLERVRAHGWPDGIARQNRILAGLAEDARGTPEGPLRIVETGWFRQADPAVDGVGGSTVFRREVFALAPPEPAAEGTQAAPGALSGVLSDPREARAWIAAVTETRDPDPRGFVEYYDQARTRHDQEAQQALLGAWREYLKEHTVILP